MSDKDLVDLIRTLGERPDLKEQLTLVLSRPPAPVNGRFEAILAEIKSLREDSNRRFDALVAEMHEGFRVQAEETRALATRVDTLATAMHEGFRVQAQESRRLATEMHEGFRVQAQESRRLWDSISALGGRWGIQTEEAVRKFATEFIASEFGVEAERWMEGDAELDLVVRDGKVSLIEITSRCDKGHMERFLRNAAAYEQATGRRAARRIVVTAHATAAAWEIAFREGVEVFTD